MTSIYPIKAGFSGGVLSPSARGKVSSDRYTLGLSECENFTITPQGSLRKRRGLRYISNLRENADDIKLVTFPISTGDDVIIVMDGEEVSLYNREGVIEGGGLYARDPYLTGRARYWKKVGSANKLARHKWEEGYRVLLQQYRSDNPIGIQQRISAPPDTYRIRFSYASQSGEAPITNPDADEQKSKDFKSVQGQLLIGTTAGAGDILTKNLATAKWISPTEYDVEFTTAGTVFYVTLRLREADSGYRTGAFYAPILLSGSDTTLQVFASPWLSSELVDVQTAVDTGTGQMFFVHPDVAPYQLSYDAVAKAWSFAIVSFTNKPVEWVDGNWPSTVEIFQGRLWLAATELQGNTIWASKVGAYETFTAGTNADDPLDLQLASSGRVLWMLGMDQLLIGTQNGEVIIGSRGDVIIGSSFYIDRQNGYSTTNIRAIYLGKQIAYIGASRRIIRSTEPSEEARGMRGTDISLASNSLFLSGVKEFAYAVEPEYQLYVVLGDGRIAVCTYDSQDELLAWYSMISQNGKEPVEANYISTAISQETGGQALWVAVRRDGFISLEVLEPDLFVRRFLDSYTFQPIVVLQQREGAYDTSYSSAFSGGFVDGETVTGVVTGLEYLNGFTVGVVLENSDTADGSVVYEQLPDALVNEGSIQVPNGSFGSVCVGVPYLATATTLPQEGGNSAGTAQGSKRKWNRIFSRLAFSAVPLLNGYRAQIGAEEVPASGNPLDADVTGDYSINNEGFDEGVVVIEQDLALRTEIAAIFGKSQASST